MRLLPGYVTAPAPARAVVIHSSNLRTAAASILDAVVIEVLAARRVSASISVDPSVRVNLRQAAIQQYCAIDGINQQPTGRLDLYA